MTYQNIIAFPPFSFPINLCGAFPPLLFFFFLFWGGMSFCIGVKAKKKKIQSFLLVAFTRVFCIFSQTQDTSSLFVM